MRELSAKDWNQRIGNIESIAKDNILANNDSKCYAFLDFDGVINLWNKPIDGNTQSINEAEYQFLDRPSVERFSGFCLESGVSIVISSSWRFKGLDYCRNYLLYGGLDPRIPVVGTTALDLDADREIHITDFLLRHPDFSSYMIFDDMQLPHLSSHEIMCDTQVGFDEEKLGEARFMKQKVFEMMEDYRLQKRREEMFSEILSVGIAK